MIDFELTSEPPEGGDLTDAIALLSSAPATSPESERHRAAMLDFVEHHTDALHRSCLAGHLTGSALVVDAARERTLVMLHAKLGMWLQPGGHADGEGHLAAVALREAQEETGIGDLRVVVPPIDFDIHTIPARGDEPQHLHLDVRFIVLAPDGAVARGNHESHDVRWVTPGELEAMATDDSLRRLASAGLVMARELRD